MIKTSMRINTKKEITAILAFLLLLTFSSCSRRSGGTLTFPEYPAMKIGFTTVNFMQAMPFTVESLEELMDYAAERGYQFIQLRDSRAELSSGDCQRLAAYADSLGIEVIYEINVNLLHPEFREVFERGLDNTVIFGEPAILRAPVANSEFEGRSPGTGWNIEELKEAVLLAEQSAEMAADTGVRFIVENIVEPFFGEPPEYFGLYDLLKHARKTGLQFDLSNAFSENAMMKADPEAVADFIAGLGDRWVTTHVKTAVNGQAMPVLGENPLPVEQVVRLMGINGVEYFSLELAAVNDKKACFDNHRSSIDYLMELGVLERVKP